MKRKYCEPCDRDYANISQHCKSEKHIKNESKLKPKTEPSSEPDSKSNTRPNLPRLAWIDEWNYIANYLQEATNLPLAIIALLCNHYLDMLLGPTKLPIPSTLTFDRVDTFFGIGQLVRFKKDKSKAKTSNLDHQLCIMIHDDGIHARLLCPVLTYSRDDKYTQRAKGSECPYKWAGDLAIILRKWPFIYTKSGSGFYSNEQYKAIKTTPEDGLYLVSQQIPRALLEDVVPRRFDNDNQPSKICAHLTYAYLDNDEFRIE